jgi:monoterpene epsilon-lactone hydrolase
MRSVKDRSAAAAICFCMFTLLGGVCAAQQTMPASAPQTDTSYIDTNGTAHVTRVVPVPKTVSPQAQKFLEEQVPDIPTHTTCVEDRSRVDAWQARSAKMWRKLYPVNLEKATIAGVSVRIVTPPNIPARNRDRVLINVHGGGFCLDSGSLNETIPIANMTQTKVVAVLYRLAPEHPFPAAVDDIVAVYKELLKTYKPRNIALYGTSAGAVLTPEVTVKLRQLSLPLPGALGVFSGFGDFSKNGDSRSMYSLQGLSGPHDAPGTLPPGDHAYIALTEPKDPVLSPIYADLKGFPPTLFVTSERDLLLSGTTTLHRAFLRAGVDAQLVVFEGLPHAFWYNPDLPESIEANRIMANFFDSHLGK